ncbi:MAG: DUF885 domain-containing protein [Rubrivivax sp.]|nr:DUF885 domain-containing protein [Rubrivivax sp.]
MIKLRQPWARLLRAGLLAAMVGLAGLAGPAAAADDTAAKALHALFDRHWQWSAETFPEFATYRGDHRYGDRLSDVSPEAIAERDRRTAQFLAEARAIPADGLSATDRVSREMFMLSQQRFLEIAAFPAARGMSLRALGGPQTQLAELLQVSPVGNVQQVNQLLARLAAYPRRMDQEIALLRASAAAGWVPARDVLQRVLVQLDAQLADDPEKTPFWTPFRRLGSAIAADERTALQRAGREAIAAQVQPALRRLRALVADELLPRAPQDGSLTRYPGGDRWYALQVRLNTTTELTPQQIHDIGQRELARLRGEMEAVMRELKFEGGFDRFVQHLNTDPRFFHSSPQALLAGYREIAKRLDAEMPRLFAELPRAPYGVAEMPAHMGPNRAEYYNGPALDGSRAGFFFANTLAFRQRPIWGMETLVAHEAVPGHHLQIARATELRGLPNFRRSGFGYTAFSEGWALYAETLGFELGLYTDPYSRFGHLQWQAFRAARLVADTGIHALGWSRQQAVDFMVERTGVQREFVEGEIDRYTSQPGQALAYMIGKLKFDELRDRARAALGPRFDIRRFHNAVLDNGALPLSVLERVVDEWVAAQRG